MTVEDALALKVVHTADWHLGKRFPSFGGADEKKLTRARMQAVAHILQLANQWSADVVLCAGDLFDEPEPAREWWDQLAKTLSTHGRPERPVILLPGNHDPLRPGSVYSREHAFRGALPAWVHVVDREDFAFELPGAVIHAVPCTSQAGQSELTSKLPGREPGDDRIRIGLLHGRTLNMPGESNFPIRPQGAEELGYDYLALGDAHDFEQVGGVSVPVVYPGAPEPTRFGEMGAGHVARVLFSRRTRPPRIQKERVGYFSWRSEVCRDLEALRQVRALPGLERTVLRLSLDLSVSLEENEELEAIVDELKGNEVATGRAALLSLERKRVELDTCDIEEVVAGLSPVLRATVRKLREAEQGEQALEARQALRQLYGLIKEIGAA